MKFNVDPKISYITGRNGSFEIPEMDIFSAGETLDGISKVYIDGIGKRGCAINGGLVVDKPSFMKGIIAFLEEQGYTVAKREEVTPTCEPSN